MRSIKYCWIAHIIVKTQLNLQAVRSDDEAKSVYSLSWKHTQWEVCSKSLKETWRKYINMPNSNFMQRLTPIYYKEPKNCKVSPKTEYHHRAFATAHPRNKCMNFCSCGKVTYTKWDFMAQHESVWWLNLQQAYKTIKADLLVLAEPCHNVKFIPSWQVIPVYSNYLSTN